MKDGVEQTNRVPKSFFFLRYSYCTRAYLRHMGHNRVTELQNALFSLLLLLYTSVFQTNEVEQTNQVPKSFPRLFLLYASLFQTDVAEHSNWVSKSFFFIGNSCYMRGCFNQMR